MFRCLNPLQLTLLHVGEKCFFFKLSLYLQLSRSTDFSCFYLGLFCFGHVLCLMAIGEVRNGDNAVTQETFFFLNQQTKEALALQEMRPQFVCPYPALSYHHWTRCQGPGDWPLNWTKQFGILSKTTLASDYRTSVSFIVLSVFTICCSVDHLERKCWRMLCFFVFTR